MVEGVGVSEAPIETVLEKVVEVEGIVEGVAEGVNGEEKVGASLMLATLPLLVAPHGGESVGVEGGLEVGVNVAPLSVEEDVPEPLPLLPVGLTEGGAGREKLGVED